MSSSVADLSSVCRVAFVPTDGHGDGQFYPLIIRLQSKKFCRRVVSFGVKTMPAGKGECACITVAGVMAIVEPDSDAMFAFQHARHVLPRLALLGLSFAPQGNCLAMNESRTLFQVIGNGVIIILGK